ncbi:hypothetical protein R4538_15660 [Vibrio cholerae]|nr:hypothetical protein R4538_15660 [Vibrio cholerae]
MSLVLRVASPLGGRYVTVSIGGAVEKIKVFWLKFTSAWNTENFIRVTNIISAASFLAYVFGMFIFPVWKSDGDWKYIHSVWYSWQALNVGMLAFASSLIAFNISRYNANKQAEREFIASKAFLPQALSILCNYLENSSKVIIEAADRSRDRKKRAQPFASTVPALPAYHAEVFKDCIKHAPPEVGKYLAKILRLLQVHHSRMEGMPSEVGTNYPYCKSCLYRLAELQFLVNGLFDFARDESNFEVVVYKWEDFARIYRLYKVELDNYPELEEFTKSLIDKS